jgi:hypothetical protein
MARRLLWALLGCCSPGRGGRSWVRDGDGAGFALVAQVAEAMQVVAGLDGRWQDSSIIDHPQALVG